MVSTGGLRLSSVVPATATCEQNRVHELTNMDLAMKLHYIKGVYLFNGEAIEGFTTDDLKKPMFQLLQLYFTASGRVRRSETGRPFIKSNDSGVRIAEAYCEETVEEWLDMAMEDSSLFDGLAYNQPLGPDLGFCPLVFLQFTWFKCGGLSVGLSWANVLGDAFSASAFINTWAKFMAGLVRQKPLHVPPPTNQELPSLSSPKSPFSLKRVDPVGDYWLTPNTCKMRKYTFHVPAQKIDQYFLSNQTANNKAPAFEVLCALIWKSLSKIKENPDHTKIVTICTNSHDREFESPSNGMVWSTVEADSLVAEADIADLVEVILQKRAEENGGITEIVGRESEQSGESDFIAYGAKLTFVNLEEADIYGLELKGQKPVFANYWINGVGDEGVVLVLPAPKFGKDENSGGVGVGGGGGRLVTVVLPENQLEQLKRELQSWSIA